jgi:ATP-dependent Clp endopeptidase proteolytic subunit ClpP
VVQPFLIFIKKMLMKPTATTIPMVIDNSDRSERAYDIYSLLLKERIVFLGTGVQDQIANLLVAQLLYLDSQSSTLPINMYINSPGGSVYAGLAILDAMRMVKAPVHTTAVGVTASMGTILLAAGEKGHRYALPHATIHMHPAGRRRKGIPKMCGLPITNKNDYRSRSSIWLANNVASRGKKLKKTSSATNL